MSSCDCKLNKEFFDLQHLRQSKRKVDNLIQNVRSQFPNLKNFYKRNTALKQFNDVTMQLIKDFKHHAETFINYLRTNKHEYGLLYCLAQSNSFNLTHVEYRTFPLIFQSERNEIILKIESIASQYERYPSLLHSITCLELLFFYALLVNPESNWIIMDYISNGNKNHQYVIACDVEK